MKNDKQIEDVMRTIYHCVEEWIGIVGGDLEVVKGNQDAYTDRIIEDVLDLFPQLKKLYEENE